MTKKIKFLGSNPEHQLSFLNVTTNKLYEITGETDTHYKCVADDGTETLLSKLGSPTKYEIIEETKPVKKYIKITKFTDDDLKNDGQYHITLNKWYEISKEGVYWYEFLDDIGGQRCINKNDINFVITQGHPHADLIQYAAELAKQTMDVGSHFQYKDGITGEWVDWGGTSLPNFNPEYEYRIKPKTIKIGDVEINAPEREPLNCGQNYYIADITDKVSSNEWCNDDVDRSWLKDGIIFLNKEDAIAATEAIISLLKA